MRDIDSAVSELSLHVAISSVIFTTTTTSSSSNRDVTGCHRSSSDTTTSSGYEPGTCWSRDDDVIAGSDDDDVRVSWSQSTSSPTVDRLCHVVSLRYIMVPFMIAESS